MKWLVANGCYVSEKSKYFDTCFSLSAELGNQETIKWLVENGCSLNEMSSCIMIA